MVRTGAASARRNGLTCRSRRGRRAGHRHKRVPQERGRPRSFPHETPGVWGTRVTNVSRSAGVCRLPPAEANRKRPERYRQAKETKRGGMNGRESQRLDSTVEAGERESARPPWREARRLVMVPLEGNIPDALTSWVDVNVTPTDSTTDALEQRIHGQRNRMRQSRTSGSAGALGGQPPRATQPNNRGQSRVS